VSAFTATISAFIVSTSAAVATLVITAFLSSLAAVATLVVSPFVSALAAVSAFVASGAVVVVVGGRDPRTDGLQLAARRCGWTLVVRDPHPNLGGLLQLCGLGGAIRLEPGRQPELIEQLRVDEVVQPGDLPA